MNPAYEMFGNKETLLKSDCVKETDERFTLVQKLKDDNATLHDLYVKSLGGLAFISEYENEDDATLMESETSLTSLIERIVRVTENLDNAEDAVTTEHGALVAERGARKQAEDSLRSIRLGLSDCFSNIISGGAYDPAAIIQNTIKQIDAALSK